MTRPKIVEENISHVKKFCINNLAGILFRHIKHPLDPRDVVDWFTAESFINQNFTELKLENITTNFLAIYAYQELKKPKNIIGSIEWKWYETIDTYNDKNPEIMNRLRRALSNISEEESQRLEFSPTKKRDAMGQLLGRFVWDNLYQRIQRDSILEDNGYGIILFG